MIIDSESEVLSDVEVILPREVMETCRDLQQGGTSCFLSVNKQDCTTSQLVIHKLYDDSIKIRITGTTHTVSCNYFSGGPTESCLEWSGHHPEPSET